MPEKSDTSDEPPKFNILDALGKEIGKREKDLAKGKKDDEKGSKKREIGPKTEPVGTLASGSPNGADASAQTSPETREEEQGAKMPPEEVLRSLTGLRDWLERELFEGRGDVLTALNGVVDKYTHETREKWSKRAKGILRWVIIIAIVAVLVNILSVYGATGSPPPWAQTVGSWLRGFGINTR